MDELEFVRAIAVEFLEFNIEQFTDDQLKHIMDVCEIELVNRMAAAAGHNEPDLVAWPTGEYTPD
jgi:hypothetical protein